MPNGSAMTTVLEHGVCAVDTEYGAPRRDASHLIIQGGRAAFVDTGVNSSVPLLLDALAQNDVDPADVDFVFLTHVHLDHAGGAGTLIVHLPNARCVLHPRGAPHMVDPARLVAGTESVYGVERTREIYGTIRPIDEDRIVIANDGQCFELDGRPLTALHTEGHARHHYVLCDPVSRGVFTGDSFGVSYREFDTAAGEIVFPTTTPVQFDPGAAHAAVERILGCEPECLYLTHYSRVGDPSRLAGQMHAGLDAYVALALQYRDAGDRTAAIEAGMLDYYEERLREHGFGGSRDVVAAVMATDIVLNTQGLEVWLERNR
jgi:glyoxylase-like metal-dependent hydrolase (beta-lactamase superfamily II)